MNEPTIETVTSGEDFIYLVWSPPSEGAPLSYNITWNPYGSVMSGASLPHSARNYTIWGLDSNTNYSGTVEANSLASKASAQWTRCTLPQGELLF